MTGCDARPAGRKARLKRGLARLAVCGLLAWLAAALAQPACAQVSTGPQMPVWSGLAQASGLGPAINVGPTAATVDLNSARTVIDWSSFNVAGGNTVTFNFGARNWIVLNRIDDGVPDTISGKVQGLVNGVFGGNVWFSAKNGLIFGSGATVDAGGLLVTASSPNLSQFLDPSNLAIDVSGAALGASGSIQIQSGATLAGHGGLVALIAQNVTSDKNSAVSGLGGSSVLYGVAESYTIRFAQTPQGDLDLVDFIVPDAGSGSLAGIGLDLQNTTSASSVFVAAVSRAQVASAVINLEGMTTAQSALSSGGDIILSGGGGIVGRQAAPAAAGATPTDFYLGKLSASRDIQLDNVGLTLAKPWPRPPKTVTPPDPSQLDECVLFDCTSCEFSCDCLSSACAPVAPVTRPDEPVIDRRSVDDSFVSELIAGRDIRLFGAQEVDIGTATAARDLKVTGDTVFGNALAAGGRTTLASEGGALHVGQLTLGGDSTVGAKGSAQIDTLGFTSPASTTLGVTAGGDATVGDGTGETGGGAVNIAAGGNAVVNLGGSARLFTVAAGGSAVLQGGALNIGAITAQQVFAKAGSISVGQATSAGDVYIIATGGDAVVGTIVAGDDAFVRATGGSAQLTFATLTGQGADAVGTAFDGNPDTAGNGRVLSVVGDLDAKVGFGAGFVNGATSIGVNAGRDALLSVSNALPAATSVTAGQDATLQAPTVSFAAVSAGRDLTLRATSGDLTASRNITAVRNITLGAAGGLNVAGITAGNGAIALSGKTVTAGALTAGLDVTVVSTGGAVSTGALSGQNISVVANGGGLAAGPLSAGQDLTLLATGGGVQIASYKVGRDLTVQGSSLALGQALSPVGRDLSITTPGDFAAPGDLAAGRNVSLVVGGAANLKAVSAQQLVTLDVQGKAQTGAITAADVHIVAADLDLAGPLTAQTAEIESRTGALRVGGSAGDAAPASGLWLDAAELGRIHAARSLTLYAGAVAGTARGDLTVLDLNLDPAATPLLNLFAGGGHNVLVQGIAAPTAAGGAVRIGDATDPAWQPASILITGALGAATFSGGGYSNVRDFDDVRLHATGDIIMGSPRFIGLIQSTPVSGIDLGRHQPLAGGPTAGEADRVFIATGRLELSAAGKVVNQDTSSDATQSVGIFLSSKASPSLVIDPPQLVDIYGSFLGKKGDTVTSFAAGPAVDFQIVDAQGNPTAIPNGASYHFNSCALGTGQCSGASQVTGGLSQTGPVSPITDDAANGSAGPGGSSSSDAGPLGDLGGPLADNTSDQPGGSDGGDAATTETASQAAARTAPGRTQTPPLASISPRDPNAALNDPVTTGAGSEEIWRGREAKR